MATDRINFVHEDDAWRVLLALLKQVAHAAGTHADEHLDEVRTRDGEERHVSFAGYRTGQQGLAGSGRADQQNALGNASTELLEFLRFAQEFNNFAQLFFGFIHAGHVFERDFLLLHGEQAGAALAEAERLVSAGLHLADHEEPQRGEQNERSEIQQPGGPTAALRVFYGDIDAVVCQYLVHVGIVRRNNSVEGAAASVAELARNVGAGDRHILHVVAVNLAKELSEVDLLFLCPSASLLDHLPQQHG